MYERGYMMNKFVYFILGILIIVTGGIPLLQAQGIEIVFLPENLLVYQIATMVLGAFILMFALKRRRYRPY